ncbi:MAG: urea ABC transporter permease subunit UrtB, partial [Planctomycetaceae bacterium]|nr:urea ABC transporter permease subunit UrtB [Planctomycetaceae bacterium]
KAAEVVYAARESIGILQLQDSAAEKTTILKAAKALGELKSLRGKARLEQELEKIDDRLLQGELIDNEIRLALHTEHQAIEQYHEQTSLLKSLFNGISTGSILILISLGLAIVFGQMGVINMAHGELVMLGAYATYVMQLSFGHTPDDPNNWFYVAALPMAFIVAATAGILIEYFVVRHLYARPLESLLATWGVGLILIQFIRAGFPWADYDKAAFLPNFLLWGGFGDNIGVNAPTWLVGAFELQPGLVIPYNRVFIIVLTMVIVATIAWMMKQTRLGLRIRATVQNRETAACLGVKTRQVDRITFAIGSGLAGIAGCALTTIAGVTPDMGQNYIVDSFLVVVTGGVGKLAGTVSAGGGIGVVNTWLETTTFGTGLFVTGLLMLVIGSVVLIRKVRSLKQMSSSPAADSLPWWKRYYLEKSVVKAVVILGMGVILMVAVRATDTNNYLFIYDEDVTVDVDDALVLVDKQGRFRIFDFMTEEMQEKSEFHVPMVLDPADLSFRQRTTDMIVQAINSQNDFAISASSSGTRIALAGVAELNFSDDMNWLGIAEKGTEGFRAVPPKSTREIPASTRIGAIPVRTIWAKVLILVVVMVFIQWRPAGLFPPRGRSADV